MREREAHNNKLNALRQCSSVKSSAEGVFQMPFPRCLVIFEKELCAFRMTLSKKSCHSSDRSRSHPVILSNVVSKQKIKMKTRNTMALSYHSKSALQKTSQLHFSLFWLMVFSISPCSGKVKVIPITLTR